MPNDKITAVGANIAEKAAMIWNVADMLRGPFKPHEYGLVILPCLLYTSVPNNIFVKVPTEQKCSSAWNDSAPCDGTEMISSMEQKCSTNQRNKNDLKNNHLIKTTDAYLTFGEYQNVFLTAKEYRRLKADFFGLDSLIEQLSAYIQSTGKKYADHAATLRIWAKRQKTERKSTPGIPDYTFTEGESL